MNREDEMTQTDVKSGFAGIGSGRIYYETAGEGTPFVMIHAGVADSRMWNHEFAYYARRYQAIRYDMRRFGRSEPVEGEFSDLEDLNGLLEHLQINRPVILMGCSMGGGLALDFAVTNLYRVRALILVGSAPNNLALEAEEDEELYEAAEKAFSEGDLDLAAELETRAWFDGAGRGPRQVNPDARRLVVEMNRTAMEHAAKKLGKRKSHPEINAAERLEEIRVPVLIVVGAQDNDYMHAAADYMLERLPFASKVIIENAAHLPNMDHPEQFCRLVDEFLAGINA